MDDRANLENILTTARMVLMVLEQQAAGYSNLTIPAHLQVQLEEKRQEVASLEARLSQLQGKRSATLPDNLPRYTDVFVGRKQEIARCLEALSPDDRGWGVTIDGIGGMGKTALALEVAHLARQQALFDAYLFASAKTTWLSPEGVRQETLTLSSLDSFCREFAKGLGLTDIVQMTDATARRRALLDALRGRRALLIWDNLETLNTEERQMIAEFLRKLPLGEWRYQAGNGLGKWSDAGWGAHHVAWIHYYRAETELAASWAARLVEAVERGGSRRDKAVATRLQGVIAEQRRDYAEAERLYQEALAIYRELGEDQDETLALNDLGGVARSQGNYALAESYFKQALAIAQKLGKKEYEASYSGSLGLLALDRKDPTAARPWYERELALAQEVGQQDLVASAQSGLARVLEEEGRYAEALPLALAALEIEEHLRDKDLEWTRRLVERLRGKS
jgi:tetratricopeptide (TPR) repeat protein